LRDFFYDGIVFTIEKDVICRFAHFGLYSGRDGVYRLPGRGLSRLSLELGSHTPVFFKRDPATGSWTPNLLVQGFFTTIRLSFRGTLFGTMVGTAMALAPLIC
jgi:hypothetical protein